MTLPAGLLEKPVKLKAAQIIFYNDGRRPLVRLNSEIKAVALAKLKQGTAKNKGEVIFDSEIEQLSKIELSDKNEEDYGHATLVRIGSHWSISFDFRYNRGLAKKHLQTAQQFLASARFSYERNNWAAFVDNLFSCCELTAKATLLVFPSPELNKKASHRSIQMKYNWFANLGNVKVEYKNTLNQLSGMRDKARYLKQDITISDKQASDLIATIEDMLANLNKQI